MAIVKDRRIVDDDWVAVDDDQSAPEAAPIVVSAKRWRRDRTELLSGGALLGIALTGDDDLEEIAEDLPEIDLIALRFLAFTDGRPYSMARILRERYGYSGEIRAVGNVLRDQASLLARCGFDAVDVPSNITVEEWLAALTEINVRYQPAADRRRSAAELRHA